MYNIPKANIILAQGIKAKIKKTVFLLFFTSGRESQLSADYLSVNSTP
jgi:hypothetical protein